MAFFNGNPYRAEVTEVVCDECFHRDGYWRYVELVKLNGADISHWHQEKPWHWAPVWSLSRDRVCDWASDGHPVDVNAGR